MPELLSPAGNFEKMKAAILYGADAVYLASDTFGMRAAADNFSLEELSEAVKYAHERSVRVYLTVNVMPREYHYEDLKAYFRALADIKPDALIVGDIGVLSLARFQYSFAKSHQNLSKMHSPAGASSFDAADFFEPKSFSRRAYRRYVQGER